MNRNTIRGFVALVSLGLSLLAGGSSVAAAGLLNNNAQVPVGSVFMFGGRRFIKLGLGTDTGGTSVAYTMMAFPFDNSSMDESASSWNTTNAQSSEPRYGSNNWIRGGTGAIPGYGSDMMMRLNSINYGVKFQYLPTLTVKEQAMIATKAWNMYAEDGTTCKLRDTSGNTPAGCLWSGKVALPSHAEWGTGTAETANTPVKTTYCQTVFGGPCPAGTASFAPRHLWLRTPQASSATSFWHVSGDGSLYANNAYGDNYGVAPALYLTSTSTTCSGSGTMNDPYYIAGSAADCANHTIPTSSPNSVESIKIGEVVEFSNRKWVKMDDIHEPIQQGRYFMAAQREASNVVFNSGVRLDEVRFEFSNLNNYLQNTVLTSMSADWLQKVSWDVSSNRDQAAQLYDSKIAVASYNDWTQRWWAWCGTAFGRTVKTCLAGDFNGANAPVEGSNLTEALLRNWVSWHVNDANSGHRQHRIRNYGYVWGDVSNDVVGSVLPVVVFKEGIKIQQEADMAGRGTLAKPYHLCDDVTVACNAAENVPPELTVASAVWDNGAGTLTLSGTTGLAVVGQDIEVWADVCNTNGECVRKSTSVMSTGNMTQAFPALVWTRNELPAGNYTGTIWVGAAVGNQVSGMWRSAESSAVSFSIAARTVDLTVVRGRAFNVTLGDASVFGMSPGTSGGVTVSVDAGTNTVSVNGTVATDAALTFGSVVLNIKTIDVPESQVVNMSLN